ncbi:hypothetical protein JOC86_002899 [Bacillus pakistanensis]|uniref:Uncharacterized protein n=1 Tax=Rossellomorea pakistanensis TaxID=992288 RepID=A0ABS2NET8_9BACI|nr:hypothetical protein [Bacillus pakistanensis]
MHTNLQQQFKMVASFMRFCDNMEVKKLSKKLGFFSEEIVILGRIT